MAYDNTNRGALFRNDKREADTDADYNGTRAALTFSPSSSSCSRSMFLAFCHSTTQAEFPIRFTRTGEIQAAARLLAF